MDVDYQAVERKCDPIFTFSKHSFNESLDFRNHS